MIPPKDQKAIQHCLEHGTQLKMNQNQQDLLRAFLRGETIVFKRLKFHFPLSLLGKERDTSQVMGEAFELVRLHGMKVAELQMPSSMKQQISETLFIDSAEVTFTGTEGWISLWSEGFITNPVLRTIPPFFKGGRLEIIAQDPSSGAFIPKKTRLRK